MRRDNAAWDTPARIRTEIEALIAHFAWLVDHKDGRGVAQLFTARGRYSLDGGELDLRGRADIDDFYERRRATGPRTSRHLFSNLHLEIDDEAHAKGTCVLTLHAADGPPPHPLSPLLIADFTDTYGRGEGNHWRFESRLVTPVFGGVPQFIRRGE